MGNVNLHGTHRAPVCKAQLEKVVGSMGTTQRSDVYFGHSSIIPPPRFEPVCARPYHILRWKCFSTPRSDAQNHPRPIFRQFHRRRSTPIRFTTKHYSNQVVSDVSFGPGQQDLSYRFGKRGSGSIFSWSHFCVVSSMKTKFILPDRPLDRALQGTL